ncbi:hypothetical protein J6X13_00520 [Candidatus Saccharibacteria bacterium]|nr:hypothetical protein [Candidatus Saccharibacteria bacterium]
MNKNPAKVRRIHYAIRAICCFILAVCAFVAITQIDYSAIFDEISSMGYEPSSELDDIVADLRLTEKGMRIFKATRAELQEAEDFNKNCPNADGNYYVLGCYNDGHVYIYNIKHKDLPGIRQSTLAHELLHAVWSRMSARERDELKSSLDAVYSSNEDVAEHLKLYDEDSFYDELHSIAGTQVDQSQMSPLLASHYAKYFERQSKVYTFFADYSNRFKAIKARVAELEESIAAKRASYEEFLKQYEADNAKLSQDITDFTVRAQSTNNGFSSVEEFNAKRQELLNRQSEMQVRYNELIERVNEINKEVNEYNSNILRNKEYQKVMNSHAKPSGEAE